MFIIFCLQVPSNDRPLHPSSSNPNLFTGHPHQGQGAAMGLGAGGAEPVRPLSLHDNSVHHNQIQDMKLRDDFVTIAKSGEFGWSVWSSGQVVKALDLRSRGLGAISLELLGGKLAPELVYFILGKELLNFGETAPWVRFLQCWSCVETLDSVESWPETALHFIGTN